MPSILTFFNEQVRRTPDRRLFVFLNLKGHETQVYTYASFHQRTTDIASHLLASCNLKKGDRVLLVYPPGVEMICAFFACVRLGLVAVPVYPPTGQGFRTSNDKLHFIARDCGAGLALTDRNYQWSRKLHQLKHRVAGSRRSEQQPVDMEWVVTEDANKGVRERLPESHCETLFLQYTSGSTNDPKGVVVTHKNLLANCEAVVDHVPIGVSWLPQYHDMGLVGYYLFFALKGGTTYGFSPLDFIQRPALWLETIQKYKATASSAPNFAFEYCLRPEKLPPSLFQGLDLSSLRCLMLAAEPIRPGVVRQFIKTFEPHGLHSDALFAAYGLAENTLAVSNYGRKIRAFDRHALLNGHVVLAGAPPLPGQTTELMSCGKAVLATEIEIVCDPNSPRVAKKGQVGEIWIRGDSKCHGYWQRPDLSEQQFGARLSHCDSKQWLRSGDLGFLHENELYVCGRIKDLIIVRGANFYPQDIEAIVERNPRLRQGCVAAFSLEEGRRERVVVVAELKATDHTPDSQELNQALLHSLGLTVDRYVYIAPRSIPKTSSGKLARYQAKKQLLNGKLLVLSQADCAPLSSPGPLETEGSEPASQKNTFATLFRGFGLTGNETSTLAEAGFDSVRMVEFAQALKDGLRSAGTEDLAEAIDLRVIQNIAVRELFDLLAQVDRVNWATRLRLRRALSDAANGQRDQEYERMQRDARLRFDVGALCSRLREPPSEAGGIFLTGGTGFFGPFLLASLLQQTDETIYILVRASSPEAGIERLERALNTTMEPGGSFSKVWKQRVVAVCGDLSRSHLGLARDTWDMLSKRVHTIFHNGAQVNYLSDYEALRDANVEATHEVVRLALTGRPKVFNHVSTTFIFGWSVQETLLESDTNAEMKHLDFGYSQSKWVSEQIVHRAMSEGLTARIFRPALLTPSAKGAGDNLDISIRLLAFMLNHRIGTSAQNQVSFSPADIAANNLVAICQSTDTLGQTYHLTRDSHATMSDVTQILSQLTQQGFREFPLRQFVPEVIGRCHKGDVLFPLLEFFLRSVDNITKMEFKRYDNRNFQRARHASRLGQADLPLIEVVNGMLKFMRAKDIVRV